MAIKKYPNGTPLPPNPTSTNPTISIASFNLLAPLYIRPIDARTGQVQPFASFEWISPEKTQEILGDEVRLPKLLGRLRRCECDFVCVQELQMERSVGVPSNGRRSGKEDCELHVIRCTTSNKPSYILPEWITPLTKQTSETSSTDNDGIIYSVILPEQSELEKMGERNQRVLCVDAPVTNAIFYRVDRWRPVSAKASGGSTTNCVVQGFVPVEQSQMNDKQSETETNSNAGDEAEEPLVIVSIHLDARSEEKRCQQLQRCLSISAKLSDNFIPPMVIAGDCNCELFRGSCVYEFLHGGNAKIDCDEGKISNCQSTCRHSGKGNSQEMQSECARALRLPTNSTPSNEQMKSWTELCNEVSNFVNDNCFVLNRVNTGTTRVAYNHDLELSDEGDVDTASCTEEKERDMEQWHLDHILYTPLTLLPCAQWSTLEDDEYSTKVGLPNERVPTDHLPIAASFRLHPHPRLDEEERSRLFATVTEMGQRQNLEMEQLQVEMSRTRKELERQHKQFGEDGVADHQDRKELERQHKQFGEDGVADHQDKKAKKKKVSKPSPEIIEHVRKSRAETKQLKAKHAAERNNFVQERTVLERMELQKLLKGTTCRRWAETGRYE